MRVIILILALAITACGGGGGGSTTTSTTTIPPTPQPSGIEAHCIPPAIEGLTPDGVVTCAIGNYTWIEAPIANISLTNLDDVHFSGFTVSPTFVNGCGNLGYQSGGIVEIPGKDTVIFEAGSSNCSKAITNSPNNYVEIYFYNGTVPRIHSNWWPVNNPLVDTWDWDKVNADCGQPVARVRLTFKIVP